MTTIKGEGRPRSVVMIAAAGRARQLEEAEERWRRGGAEIQPGMTSCRMARVPVQTCSCIWGSGCRGGRKRGTPGCLAHPRGPGRFPVCLGIPGKCAKGLFLISLSLTGRKSERPWPHAAA